MGENPEEQDKMADTLKTDILVERQDKRRLSSGSSTQSKGGARKKTKMGLLDEEELEKDEHEDKEFEDAFEKAPDWAKGMMSYLRNAVESLQDSSYRFQTEINALKEDYVLLHDDTDHKLDLMERDVDFVSEKYEDWKKEKEDLLKEIREMKSFYEEKVDDLEQYSRRSCLVMTGVKETRGEDTDQIVEEILFSKLGLNLAPFEVQRTHRLGQIRDLKDGRAVNHPIIIRFVGYKSRDKVFKVKRKLIGTGFSIFENLMERRAELLQEVKKIAGYKNVWTMDGRILTFGRNGQKIQVRRKEDFRNVRLGN